MKIGIDGTPLSIPFPCGTKRYANELISTLAKIDKTNEYFIFSKSDVAIPKQRNFKLVTIPSSIPIFKRHFFLSYFAKKNYVDVFHNLFPFGSLFLHNLNVITTIHDVDLDKIFPKEESFGGRLRWKYVEFIRSRIIAQTKSFIAVSKYTKNQLKEITTLPKTKKAYVIYEAPGRIFRVIKTHRRPIKRYLLCLGDFSPRKNLDLIFKCYSDLPTSLRKKYCLKVVASTPDAALNFRDLAEKFGILKNVSVLERISDYDLMKLYNSATVFLYPSLYEGFGLPVLEAMACGCPVITSNNGSTKEIAQSAALLVNPKSHYEMRKAIINILNSKKLQKTFKHRGLKRVKQFSWEKAAKQTLEVYKKVSKA